MKYLPLMWAGLWRTPMRSALTVLSMVVAFTLFGLLQSVNALFDDTIAQARLDRLTVTPYLSGDGRNPLPLAYRDQIARLPGVTVVATVNGIGGYYQVPKNRFGIMIADEDWFAANDEFDVPASARTALAEKRNAVLVSVKLAQLFGWKVGDTISLQSTVQRTDNSAAWPFEVAAIVPDVDLSPNGFALGNYSYFDESRAANRGTANGFTVRIADPARSEELSARIDGLFANASVPTHTQSQRVSAQMQFENTINIKFVTTSIVAAVFFMLLFMTSNAVAQSVRERIPEFAILKTIGFSDSQAFVLVLGETLTLCLLGAAAGLVTAHALTKIVARVLGSGFIVPTITVSIVITGVAVALAVAALSGAQPAWRMKRLEIVDALAGR